MSTLVLVVDDDADVRSVVVLTLTLAGFEVVEASTVSGGVELLISDSPEVVVTDMSFGGESGEVVVEACGERDVPVIVMTASVSDDVLGPLAVAGVRVLSKPFSLDAMVELVREAAA